MARRFTGVVVKATGSWYSVRGDEVFKARLRGKLRLAGSRSTNPVVVGDVVECVQDGDEVWIEKIEPRRNYIIRRSTNLSRESHIIAANVDQAVVVATLFSPAVRSEFIDRFLVTCEAYGIPARVVLNKSDLYGDHAEEVERFTNIYKNAGYSVLLASSESGQGVAELRELLQGKTTLVSGNSGVGKSTLVKAVEPGLDVRIGEVSRAHDKGMHTTTFSQMYPLSQGGYIIDTPGIKGFGLIDISPDELARYFPDLARLAPECGYYNCTHTHEPDCAVLRAVDEGAIAPERYDSYLKMLEEDTKHR